MKINIGRMIRGARSKKKMPQRILAEQLSVTPATVSAWELNKISPPLPVFFELIDILDLPVIFNQEQFLPPVDSTRQGTATNTVRAGGEDVPDYELREKFERLMEEITAQNKKMEGMMGVLEKMAGDNEEVKVEINKLKG